MIVSNAQWQRLELTAITLQNLDEIRRFVRSALDAGGVSDLAEAVVLAVDEVCANLVMHGYAGRSAGHVGIALAVDTDAVRIVVEDEGHPFHPNEAPLPDMTTDWSKRQVGGLGWFLVRRLMDSVEYEIRPDGNRLSLMKRRGHTATRTSGTTITPQGDRRG